MRPAQELDARLGAVVAAPGRELSGLALVAFRNGFPFHEAYFGARVRGSARSLPVDRNTMWRVASISKVAVGIAAMRLVERGLLDPRRDISDYLGFTLRNPSLPDTVITAEALLSHSSGLRDSGFYTPPPGLAMRDLLTPGGARWEGGAHFSSGEPGSGSGPAGIYEYCNLNYGVLATAMERITRTRFDLLMRDEVLAPLGFVGSFNVNLVPDARFGDISPLYRKRSPEGDEWNPEGPWIAQTDDFRGAHGGSPVRPPAPDLSGYVPGTNGAIFSPQGGLRISAPDLAVLGSLLAGGGAGSVGFGTGDARLLREESLRWMCEPRWESAEPHAKGLARATGWGLMKNSGLDGRADRWWGHHGDAYGFNGALLFDPEGNEGYLYMIGGISEDPETMHHPVSGMSIWEHEIREAAESLLFGH